MKTSPNSVWLWPMAPVHFPTWSAYRFMELFVGTSYAQQGVFLSRESISPTTQKEMESSGMKDREKEESGVKRRNGRGKPLLLSRKVIG